MSNSIHSIHSTSGSQSSSSDPPGCTVRQLDKLQRQLTDPIKSHIAAFVNITDPIQVRKDFVVQLHQQQQSAELNPKHPPNYQFLFPLIITCFVSLFGTYGFHYEALGPKFDQESFQSSRYVFTHQMVPKSVWSQIDFGILIDVLATIPLYVVYIFNSNIQDRFQVFTEGINVFVGSYVFEERESRLMLSFRKRIKFALQFLIASFYVLLMVEFMIHVWVVNAVFNPENLWFYFLFWLLLFPMFAFYIIYGLFGSIVYVILVSKIIRIRQESILNKLLNLNTIIRKNLHLNKNIKNHSYKYWSYYLELNRSVIQLCHVTAEYTSHCIPILTIAIPYYVLVQCYMLYIVFFANSDSTQKYIFLFDLLVIDLFLFVIINECATVTTFNKRLELANGKFYFYFTQWNRKRQFNWIHKAHFVKADFLQTHRRLHSYAFRMAGNFRIDRNTFHLILSYILIIFMFIFKKQYSTPK